LPAAVAHPSFQINQMTIAFTLSNSQQADLQRLLANQQDRSSPKLSPLALAKRIRGPVRPQLEGRGASQGVARIGGFRVDYVPPSKNFLVFSGTAQQVQATFATEIHFYQVDGKLPFAHATDLSVPSDLAGDRCPRAGRLLAETDRSPDSLRAGIHKLDDSRPLSQPG
jgi:hypothetical protein